MFFVRTDTKVFEALVSQSVDPIAITAAHGGPVQLNAAWHDTLGWTLEELTAASLLHFVHFSDIPSMLETRARLELPGTHSIHGELRFLHKDGEWRTLEYNATSFDGNHFTIYHDVTHRIQAELTALNALDNAVAALDALRETNGALEEASSSKSEFIASLSHEMRTPLNAVIGFAQILQSESDSPKDVELANHIRLSSLHLLELTDDAVAFARDEADDFACPVAPLTLKNVVRECVENVAPLARAQRIDLMLRHTPNVEVLANGRRVKQVLTNLLSNAIKYNRKNGVVIVGSNVRGGRLRVAVSDTGPGLDAEHVDRLFTPYDRLDVDDAAVEGSGLGLALSKRFVEAMGGAIGVESAPGDGSTFWVEFPLAS
jgi:PAS domain S-box-containing protein